MQPALLVAVELRRAVADDREPLVRPPPAGRQRRLRQARQAVQPPRLLEQCQPRRVVLPEHRIEGRLPQQGPSLFGAQLAEAPPDAGHQVVDRLPEAAAGARPRRRPLLCAELGPGGGARRFPLAGAHHVACRTSGVGLAECRGDPIHQVAQPGLPQRCRVPRVVRRVVQQYGRDRAVRGRRRPDEPLGVGQPGLGVGRADARRRALPIGRAGGEGHRPPVPRHQCVHEAPSIGSCVLQSATGRTAPGTYSRWRTTRNQPLGSEIAACSSCTSRPPEGRCR